MWVLGALRGCHCCTLCIALAAAPVNPILSQALGMHPTAPAAYCSCHRAGGWTTAMRLSCAPTLEPPSSCWLLPPQLGQALSSGCAAMQMQAAAHASCRRRVRCVLRCCCLLSCGGAASLQVGCSMQAVVHIVRLLASCLTGGLLGNFKCIQIHTHLVHLQPPAAELLPPKPRPKTSAAVARRLIGGALNMRLRCGGRGVAAPARGSTAPAVLNQPA